MFDKLVRTDHNVGATLLRLALGIVMFPHGAQKVLGCFGGYGFTGTMTAFTEQMHIPMIFAFLAICAEFLGSLGLISGFLTRVAAFGIFCVMLVAALLVHVPNGFFMNWSGAQKGEGFEYHILAIGIAVVLMLRGGGAWSVDEAIAKRRMPGV